MDLPELHSCILAESLNFRAQVLTGDQSPSLWLHASHANLRSYLGTLGRRVQQQYETTSIFARSYA